MALMPNVRILIWLYFLFLLNVLYDFKQMICLIDYIVLLMDSSDILNEIQKIQKEGSCEKQSRVFKTWRKRWIVLTPNLLLTYKQKRVYKNPTQVIQLREVVSIKTNEQHSEKPNMFKVETNQTTFYFSCESGAEKEQWIGSIGKAMVQRNNRARED